MARMRWMGTLCAVALGALVGGPVRAEPSAPRAATEPAATAAASDKAITAEIKDALAAKSDMRNASIAVTTHDGVVSLTGTVASPELRQTAIDTARETRGVLRVEDHMRLVGNTPADPEVPMR
jgi:hypothetical protein